ncbi:MAG: hypothetical protein KAU20_04285 [Nanoarchaeota archaeon]|nr:hypothetical protein [Nanoarchaeota archaeon]
MNTKKLLLPILIFTLFTTMVLAVPELSIWRGTVYINGTSATAGVNVSGYVAGTLEYTTYTGEDEVPSSFYNLVLEGSVGDNVTFKVFDIDVIQGHRNWSEGIFDLDINVTTLANGASCTYSAACSGGYCCSGATQIRNGSGSGTCQSSACTAATTPSGGGGGGGAVAAQSIVLTEVDTAYTGLARGEKLTFTFDGASHTLKINKVAADRKSVEFLLTSTPMYFTLNIGEEKIIDLDTSVNEKLYVKLTGINNRKADIIVKKIVEKALPVIPPAGEEEVKEEVEEEVPSEEEELEEVTPTTEKAKLPLAWIMVALVVVIGLIIYFVVSKKKKESF